MAKIQNRQHDILEFTRSHPAATRPRLAEHLGLSLPTVSLAVRRLLESGILVEDGRLESSGGRRAAVLKVDPHWLTSIGLSVSMSGVYGVVANLGGEVLSSEQAEWRGRLSRDNILEKVNDVAAALLESSRKRPAGIGLGVTGLVNHREGVSLRFPYVEEWRDVPLAHILEERFGAPVYLDNDVNASTLAELRFGRGRGIDNFLYVFVGRGIGLGIVVDGRLYRGFSGNAGELGHMATDDTGRLCHCGNYGCLETVAGPDAIVRDVEQAVASGAVSAVAADEAGNVTIESVLEAAASGDRLAENAVSRAAGHLGTMIANMANLFDPEVVILGGILSRAPDPVMETLKRTFDSRVLASIAPTVRLQVSDLGPEAGALGAADVVFENAITNLGPVK